MVWTRNLGELAINGVGEGLVGFSDESESGQILPGKAKVVIYGGEKWQQSDFDDGIVAKQRGNEYVIAPMFFQSENLVNNMSTLDRTSFPRVLTDQTSCKQIKANKGRLNK